MKKTVVFFCYARSGGTLLNRMLGSLPGTIVLSEVNKIAGAGPKNSNLRTVKGQAKEWYGIEIQNDLFEEAILELREKAVNLDCQLVVRDWPFVNFVPKTSNVFNPPNKLLTHESFKDDPGFIFFALVRDPIDVWLSMEKSTHENSDRQLVHLLRFIQEIKKQNIRIFKYEDLCKDPEKTMKKICEYSKIPFSKKYENQSTFTKLHGDINEPTSRGFKQETIKFMPRRDMDVDQIRYLKDNTHINEINLLLDYPIIY